MTTEADVGKYAPAAIGAAALACAEFTPIGSAVCALGASIASAFTALGVALTAAERDTFKPNQQEAAAWLTIMRLAPMATQEGIDNTGEPYQAQHLVRRLRAQAGEVPVGHLGNNGVMYNPSNPSTENPYLGAVTVDPEEPLTNLDKLKRIQSQYATWQKAGSNLKTFARDVPTLHPSVPDSKALLALLRGNLPAFQSISSWDTFTKYKPEFAEGVRAARIRAGEKGPDDVLALLFGDVSVPAGAATKPTDPKMSGAPSDSSSGFWGILTATVVAGGVIAGGLYAYPFIFPKHKRPSRR